MDDISKNIDFSRKNKVFSIQNPHMYLYSHDFPHIWVQFRNMFFLPYFTHFSFFCEKMKNHILYKTHKTKHFRIKFPICTYHFGNIKKNTIYDYLGKKRFFFLELFENVHIEKIRQKTSFISIMAKMITFLHQFREKSTKFFNFTLWSRDWIHQHFEAFCQCGHDPPRLPIKLFWTMFFL